MSILARVFVIIIFVCAILFVGVNATLWHHQRDWRESFHKIRHDYQELVAYHHVQVKALREVLENRDSLIRERNISIQELQKSIRSLAADLATAVANYATTKQDMVSLLNDHTTVLAILSGKDNTIRTLTQERDNYKDRFQKAFDQKTTVEIQVARLQQIKGDLERKLNDLRIAYADTREQLNEKELVIATLIQMGIPVNVLVTSMPAPPIDAKVVAVQEDVNLVLISAGADDGVKVGYEFSIYSGESFVAKVIVEKVLKDVSGCRILFQVNPIQVNYNASTHLN